MKQHLAVSAIGSDRTGMVHELTRVITDCGGSIAESRMAALGSEFAILMLVHGNWPRAEARLQLAEPRWAGLGIGHGCLTSREVVATATSKRLAGVRSVRLRLPDPQGRLALAAPVAPVPVRLKAAG